MRNHQYILLATAIFGLLLLTSISKLRSSDDWDVPSKYKNMKNPYANSADKEQIGRRTYAIQCKSCHGSKGKGDGTKAAQLDTKVPDLTSDSFKAQTDGEIYYKTVFGKGDMPGFNEKIKNEEDRWLLVNYLKSL